MILDNSNIFSFDTKVNIFNQSLQKKKLYKILNLISRILPNLMNICF